MPFQGRAASTAHVNRQTESHNGIRSPSTPGMHTSASKRQDAGVGRPLPGNLFDGLASMDILDLEYNNLTTLPSGLFAGLNLRFLGLEANQLRTLSAGMFDSLSGSLTLDLSHNQLATLEDRVFASLDVEWLDLANNRLQTLPAGVFSGLTSLEGPVPGDESGRGLQFHHDDPACSQHEPSGGRGP